MKWIAGPCGLLPDVDRMIKLAEDLRCAGADVFRGGIWKGGVFPPKYELGWGTKDPDILRSVKQKVNIPVATEIRNIEQWQACYDFLDYAWTPARGMQNYDFVRRLLTGGKTKTLMIKRGLSAVTRDVLGIIEHARDCGYPLDNLWVIERGISSINSQTRFRLDLMIVPEIKNAYPEVKVMVDVSHGTWTPELIIPMAKAAKGAGADGIMVEVMDKPEDSISDKDIVIDVEHFKRLVKELK